MLYRNKAFNLIKLTSFTSQSNFVMNDNSIPPDEDARLKNLHEYNIMDTPPEIIFDEITELASEILQCPVSFIQFMGNVKSSRT